MLTPQACRSTRVTGDSYKKENLGRYGASKLRGIGRLKLKGNKDMRVWQRWAVVILFAAAMAWVESAVVLDLRTLVSRIQPYQANPLPHSASLGTAEVVREAATLVMLATVGWLAGRTWRSRLGYAMVAFGVWDILYYVWLKVISGWPRSLFDWDVLFLLPVPWWGPVLAPVLISGLMIAGGTLVSVFEAESRPVWPGRLAWALNLGGAALALYIFMAKTLHAALSQGSAVRTILPDRFNWPLFLAALALLAAPIVDASLKLWSRRLASAALSTARPGGSAK